MLSTENAVLGSRLATRLSELGYQTRTVGDLSDLFAQVEREKPFLLVAELGASRKKMLEGVRLMRSNEATRHILVLGIDRSTKEPVSDDALAAGVTLVTMESRILEQLPDLLEQLLAVE